MSARKRKNPYRTATREALARRHKLRLGFLEFADASFLTLVDKKGIVQAKAQCDSPEGMRLFRDNIEPLLLAGRDVTFDARAKGKRPRKPEVERAKSIVFEEYDKRPYGYAKRAAQRHALLGLSIKGPTRQTMAAWITARKRLDTLPT